MARRTTTPTTTNGGEARSATPGVSATGSAKARSAGGIVAEALTAHPDHTAADLAALTGLGASTVTKALAALEQAGHARRTTPDAQAGTRRPAARWQPVCPAAQPRPGQPAAQRHRPTAKTGPAKTGTGKTRTNPEQPAAQSAQGQPEADTAIPAGEQTTGDSTPARTGRLGKGQLGTLVLEYLIAHPSDELGPTAIGKALARSQGAVANCLTKLATSGDIVQTSDKPRRFRLAS